MIRLVRIKIAFLSMLFFTTLPALGKYKENRWTHFGLRPLGMGNAYVAIADDFNALFYNPAGLGRLSDWDGELFNPSFEVSTKTFALVSDVMDMMGGGLDGINGVLDLFSEQKGTIHRFSFTETPHFVTKSFGFGLGLESSILFVARETVELDLTVNVYRFYTPISYAVNFFKKALTLGFTLKGVGTFSIDETMSVNSLDAFSGESDLNEFLSAGFGVGADVGLLFTPMRTMRPTFGLSIINFGGVSFTPIALGTSETKTPKPMLPAVNTGFSIVPFDDGGTSLRFSVDTHMINRPIHFSHKLHIGAELGLGGLLKIQTGLKDGLITAGLQFDVGLLNLRLITYAVDHSPVVGLMDSMVERRVAAQMKLLL